MIAFSSALPLALISSTLQSWMKSENINISAIGMLSLVGMPYSLKFIWAPLVDFYTPLRLGRRKSWLLLMHASLIFFIFILSRLNPGTHYLLVFILAIIIAFCSATLDIAFDAFKIDILAKLEYATGSAFANFGYRLGMITSSAGALSLSEIFEWQAVYFLMGCLVVVGLITTFFIKEPKTQTKPFSVLHAFKEPLMDFLNKKNIADIISFILLYKLDVVVSLALMTPFLMELGFSRTEIGYVSKAFGVGCNLIGSAAGAFLIARIGLYSCLWIFEILQIISGGFFYTLAIVGYNKFLMITTITTENLFSGMGNSAYTVFLMSLCNPKYSATQFALTTSLMAVTRNLIGVPAGYIASNYSWPTYFIISMLCGIPSLFVLYRSRYWKNS